MLILLQRLGRACWAPCAWWGDHRGAPGVPGTGQRPGAPGEHLCPWDPQPSLARALPARRRSSSTRPERLPCPGICPGISPGSTEGAQLGAATSALRTPGTVPPHPPLLGSGQPGQCQHCPAVPPHPQGTLWPQTQPSSGRKAEGNPCPHLAAAPSPAQPGTPPWHHRGWVGTRAPTPLGLTGGSGATAPALLSPRQPLPRGVWGVCGFPGLPLPLPGTALPWLGVRGCRVAGPRACQHPPLPPGVPIWPPQPISQPPGQSPPRAQVLLIFKSFCNKSF